MNKKLSSAEIQDLLNQYIQIAEAYQAAVLNNIDYVEMNKNTEALEEISRKLEEAGALDRLLPLREHPNSGVRRCAAGSTIKLDREGSIQVLEEIAQGEGLEAVNAGMVLDILTMQDDQSMNSNSEASKTPLGNGKPLNGDPSNN